jgi:hypothetical protein
VGCYDFIFIRINTLNRLLEWDTYFQLPFFCAKFRAEKTGVWAWWPVYYPVVLYIALPGDPQYHKTIFEINICQKWGFWTSAYSIYMFPESWQPSDSWKIARADLNNQTSHKFQMPSVTSRLVERDISVIHVFWFYKKQNVHGQKPWRQNIVFYRRSIQHTSYLCLLLPLIDFFLFYVPLKNISLYIETSGLQNLGLCSALRALEQEGSLSCHTCCDTGLRTVPFSRLLRHNGMWRINSNSNPHRSVFTVIVNSFRCSLRDE